MNCPSVLAFIVQAYVYISRVSPFVRSLFSFTPLALPALYQLCLGCLWKMPLFHHFVSFMLFKIFHICTHLRSLAVLFLFT